MGGGGAWHSGAPLTASKYRGSVGLLISTATLTNHHNYDLMRGGERNGGQERGSDIMEEVEGA